MISRKLWERIKSQAHVSQTCALCERPMGDFLETEEQMKDFEEQGICSECRGHFDLFFSFFKDKNSSVRESRLVSSYEACHIRDRAQVLYKDVEGVDIPGNANVHTMEGSTGAWVDARVYVSLNDLDMACVSCKWVGRGKDALRQMEFYCPECGDKLVLA